MTIDVNTLQNIRKMLDRTTLTGPEAIAWVQAQQAIQQELTLLNPAPPAVVPPAEGSAA